MRLVRGDFATTANFALVVSGVPTSGESDTTNGAAGTRGSRPARPSRRRSQVPIPTPPTNLRSTSSGRGIVVVAPVETSTRHATP